MISQSITLPKGGAEIIKARLVAMIGKLDPARAWEITIREFYKRRSDQQNRYLWGVAYATLARATGQPAADWHEYMLGEHFGWEEAEFFGRKKIRPRGRSSKLSTVEFMDFVTFIQQRSAENGVFIPDPEPMHGFNA